MSPLMKCLPLIALLAACGTAAENPALELAKDVFQSVGKPDTPPATLAQQRTALIEKARTAPKGTPIMLVELPSAGAAASLSVVGQNGGAQTWFDPTGVSLVTRNGVVIATRGLGFDLMSSDTRGTQRALRGGGSGYTRLHRYLTGEGLAQDITFTCDVARSAGQLTETCTHPEGSFTNTYELRGGDVIQSRQWLGRQIGYANITRLQ